MRLIENTIRIGDLPSCDPLCGETFAAFVNPRLPPEAVAAVGGTLRQVRQRHRKECVYNHLVNSVSGAKVKIRPMNSKNNFKKIYEHENYFEII